MNNTTNIKKIIKQNTKLYSNTIQQKIKSSYSKLDKEIKVNVKGQNITLASLTRQDRKFNNNKTNYCFNYM